MSPMRLFSSVRWQIIGAIALLCLLALPCVTIGDICYWVTPDYCSDQPNQRCTVPDENGECGDWYDVPPVDKCISANSGYSNCGTNSQVVNWLCYSSGHCRKTTDGTACRKISQTEDGPEFTPRESVSGDSCGLARGGQAPAFAPVTALASNGSRRAPSQPS